MAQKYLDAIIRLMGQQMPSFTALGASLEMLGQTVDRIGGKIREFEKESVKVYKDYDDHMRGVRSTLIATYDSMTLYARDMKSLEDYASQWASTSIFHTNDVAEAMEEAAHAGWDYQQIIQGIPNAMLIAQAGGLSLSEGLDYLVNIMNTTHSEFDDMGTVIDQWARAANSSATTIDEMGQAFMTLSASAGFGDTTQELFTMAAVLANVGIKGSSAGTQLRNAMLRVVAPTKKASDAMLGLGFTEDELAEWEEEWAANDISAQLEEIGFSAYDAQGNLKPMVEIFSDLNKSLEGMSDQERYDILKNIFPTRSISAALAILDAMNEGSFWEIYENVGDSEGYTQTVSDIMMGGLTGALELFYSKWEEFERKVGEVIAPWLEKIAGWLGDIIDWLNSLDPVTLNMLVGGLTTLATLGPGLMAAGLAIKLIGLLGPYGLAFLGLAVGVGALAAAMSKLNEIKFNEHFGELELDLTELGTYVDGLGTKFDTEYDRIAVFETELETATSQYSALVTRLNENLLTDVLTQKELTSTEQEALQGYADQIYAAVIEGIATSKAADMTFLEALFGDGETPEQVEAGNTAAQVMEQYYGGLYDEAYAVGEELRHQFTLAMADNVLDEQERLAIQSTVDRYNEIMAQVQDRLSTEAYLETLYDAQHLGWEGIKPYFASNVAKEQEEIESIEAAYRGKWAHYRAAYMDAIENGRSYYSVDGQTLRVTEEDWAIFEAQLEAEKQAAIRSAQEKYGGANAAAMRSLFNDSKVSGAWRLLESLAIDEEGNWSFTPESWTGAETADDLQALVEGLEWLDQNARQFTQYLGEDAVSEHYKALLSLGQEVARVVGPAADDMRREEEATIGGMWRQIEDLETKIKTSEARVETPYEESGFLQMRYQRNAYEDQLQAEHQAWLDDNQMANLQSLNQMRLDIEAMREQVGQNPLVVTAELDTSAIDGYEPPAKTMKVMPHNYVSLDQFAEGGRATVASIFGEDGAEWAIPEEHSARTADLLNRARAASGFSWGDLISRYGGLNGGGGGNVTLNYAPVINAQNADGVAGVLAADRDRLMRLIRDAIEGQRFRDSVVAYA